MEKFELEALWWLREAGQLILNIKNSYKTNLNIVEIKLVLQSQKLRKFELEALWWLREAGQLS